ncbi:MAG: hypothetical protein JO236_00395 [Mycobacterium sp.]|uniref:hypothetical protein n=1 Tax=Mycobacterium sp. TaxID=1785 RepID=UPI001EC6C9E7|nr:hypothetical protein [Mycobacterium sp.]MBW0015999.1 hypothetical protein [Mycobacterium sp.]
MRAVGIRSQAAATSGVVMVIECPRQAAVADPGVMQLAQARVRDDRYLGEWTALLATRIEALR